MGRQSRPVPGSEERAAPVPRRRCSARAARPAGVRASGHGHRGPTGVVPRRSRCKSCRAPSLSAGPRALGPGRAGRAGGRARRAAARGGRVYLEAGTRVAGRQPGPRSPCRPLSPRGASPTPAGRAAAGLTGGARGLAGAGKKWREKGLFRVARRAEAPAEPGRRPAGRIYFRFRSQPAAPVKFLNLAPGRGDRSGGASPAGRGRVAASPLRGAASGRCSPRAPSDAARGAAARGRGGGRGRLGPRSGGAAGREIPGARAGEAGSPGRGHRQPRRAGGFAHTQQGGRACGRSRLRATAI